MSSLFWITLDVCVVAAVVLVIRQQKARVPNDVQNTRRNRIRYLVFVVIAMLIVIMLQFFADPETNPPPEQPRVLKRDAK